MTLALNILGIVVASLAIWWFSEKLESSARVIGDHLKWPDSVRGAVLYAIPSSFPELAVVIISVLLLETPQFDIGLGTVVGSAVFNILVIPGLSVIAARSALKKEGKPFGGIEVSPRVILRDGLFYLLVVGLLLTMAFTGSNPAEGELSLAWAGGFIALYAAYVLWLYIDTRSHKKDLADNSAEEPQPEGALLPAVAILIGAMCVIGVVCYYLVEFTIEVAHILHIDTYFVAVVLTAAATSIPDAVISVIAAKKGGEDSEEAIVNAFSSNIFDILVCLAAPVLILGTTVIVDVQTCKVSLILLPIVTVLAVGMMGSGNRLRSGEGLFFLILYVLFAVGSYFNTGLLSWLGWA